MEDDSGLLEGLLNATEINVPGIDQQTQIQKQQLAIEDQLGILVNSLSDIELQKLLAPDASGLNLYQNIASVQLDESTNDVDPLAFISYLARCAAVNSSTLHKMYLETRLSGDQKYAPIPT